MVILTIYNFIDFIKIDVRRQYSRTIYRQMYVIIEFKYYFFLRKQVQLLV